MNGQLLTQDFLREGIKTLKAWDDLALNQVHALRRVARDALIAASSAGTFNEASTEADVIIPVLHALGWSDILPQ